MTDDSDPDLRRFIAELRECRKTASEDTALEFLSAGLTVLPMQAVVEVRRQIEQEGESGVPFLDLIDGHLALRELSPRR